MAKDLVQMQNNRVDLHKSENSHQYTLKRNNYYVDKFATVNTLQCNFRYKIDLSL